MQSRADLFAIADALPPPRSLPTGGLPALVTSARIGPESDLQPWQKELTQDCERRDWDRLKHICTGCAPRFPGLRLLPINQPK